MLTDNYTEKLIGIKDAILLNVENIQDTMIIELKMKSVSTKALAVKPILQKFTIIVFST